MTAGEDIVLVVDARIETEMRFEPAAAAALQSDSQHTAVRHVLF